MVVTPVGGAAVTTDYVVDTAGGLSHVVAEVRGGAVEALYVRAGGMLLSEIRGTTVRYPEAEGIGSVRSLLDGAGVQTDTWRYTAFGEETARSGTNANPYQFAGERNVGAVGLYQNRARWLGTSVGAFVSVDPLLRETASPYGYAHAEPIGNSDSTGLFGENIPAIAPSIRGFKERTQVGSSSGGTGGIFELWCRNADAQYIANNVPILGLLAQMYDARHCGVRIRYLVKEGDAPSYTPFQSEDILIQLSDFEDRPGFDQWPFGPARGKIKRNPWTGPDSNTGFSSNMWVTEAADWIAGFGPGERQLRALQTARVLENNLPVYALFTGPNSNTFARIVISSGARAPRPTNTPGWDAVWPP